MNAFRDLQARTRHQGVDLSEVLDDLLGELARRDEIASSAKDLMDQIHDAYDRLPVSQVSEDAALRKAIADAERRLGDAQAGEAYGREVREAEILRLGKALVEAERKVEAQRAEISRLTDKVQGLQSSRIPSPFGHPLCMTGIQGKRYAIVEVVPVADDERERLRSDPRRLSGETPEEFRIRLFLDGDQP